MALDISQGSPEEAVGLAFDSYIAALDYEQLSSAVDRTHPELRVVRREAIPVGH